VIICTYVFLFSVPISLARGVLKYNSDDERILSFGPGETLTIFSKEAGSRLDLWGAEVTNAIHSYYNIGVNDFNNSRPLYFIF
jgi:hypothetical protein